MNEIFKNENENNGKYGNNAGETTDTRVSGLAALATVGAAGEGNYEVVYGTGGQRRNGKIARLPKATREKLNQLLDDGVSYEKIIEILGPEGSGLNKQNICNWAQGGYRDWVKEQERRVLLQGNFERVVDSLTKAEPEEVPDLIVKLLAARMGGVLSELTPQDLRENSDKHPLTLARLLALVPKLSREALRTRKFRREMQKEDSAQLKQLDPKREFDEDEHLAIVDRVNQMFGLRQYRKPGKEGIGAPAVAVLPAGEDSK